MLNTTCCACRYGDCQHCQEGQPPPPGMFGGWQCVCTHTARGVHPGPVLAERLGRSQVSDLCEGCGGLATYMNAYGRSTCVACRDVVGPESADDLGLVSEGVPVSNQFADFDAYCDEHNVPMHQTHVAFGQWLADKTKAPIIGREVAGDGLTVALPDAARHQEEAQP